MNASRFKIGERRIVGIIGDEDTVTGFLLAGIGENRILTSGAVDSDKKKTQGGATNYFVVNSTTPLPEIEAAFSNMSTRNDIGIIIICQHIANDIRHLIQEHSAVVPCVLEIPSKGQRYDAEKDYVLERVSRALGIR